MSTITMRDMLQAGVHFGHHTRRWNPKMKEYIYGERNGVYIIDLQKTVTCVEAAYKALKEIVDNGGKVLFVGTKKQAQEAVKEEALRTDSYYVNQRWLGGTLTNFRTIRKRVKRLEESGVIEGYKAIINPNALGRVIKAFVNISLSFAPVNFVTSI